MCIENQPTNLELRPVSQPVFEQRLYVALLLQIMDFKFTDSYVHTYFGSKPLC